MRPIAIIGCGIVGRAWAISFARGGRQVNLWDADPAAAQDALSYISDILTDLQQNDLLGGQSPEAILERLRPVPELDAALENACHVQENTPEKVEIKRDVFAQLDALAPADAILASSTSALLPSTFTERLAGRHRCLVAHPINPPYLVPAVEVVPAPWTDETSMATTRDLMRQIGQSPLMMKREIDGFIMNRMQGALLEEAFRLVAGGHASMEDVDIGIREGLALRWSFMGPFETIDLNAPAGVRDYVVRYQGMYEHMFPQMCERVNWEGPVLSEIEGDRRKKLPEENLSDRQKWRDRRLMALAAHKRNAEQEYGE